MSAFEFIIHQRAVVCTMCDKIFATPVNQACPDMDKKMPVDSDLHRILPFGAVRASMVAICPFCQYAWWASTFANSFSLPVGIPQSPSIDQPRKFAHAVLTGRKNNFHILDRALLALNGYWCAQECGEQTTKWLSLAIQELTAALADQNWDGNRARYHYILAELLRQQGAFTAACHEFELVDESAKLPADLIRKVNQLASKQESCHVFLTDEQVEKIFFPALELNLSAEFLAAIKAADQEAEEMLKAEAAAYIEATEAKPAIPLIPISPIPMKKQKASNPSAWAEVQTAGR
jgi:hypothetical protein